MPRINIAPNSVADLQVTARRPAAAPSHSQRLARRTVTLPYLPYLMLSLGQQPHALGIQNGLDRA